MWVHAKPATSRAARALLMASAVALVMGSFDAQAAPAAPRQAADTQQLAAVGDSDFSARKKRARRGNAAGLAMMGMMIGTVGAVIANQQRREAYERAYVSRPAYVQYPGHYAQHGYVPRQGYVRHRGYRQGPAYGTQGYRAPPVQSPGNAVGHYTNPYDDPNLARLNAQTPGTIMHGPVRAGW